VKLTPEEYNKRVQEFIDKNLFDNKTIVLIDRGRTINERSAVLIENGIYKGYAFYDLNYQIRNIEILRNILVHMPNNRDTRTIIQSQIRRSRSLKLLYF
jgi:DNA polymerase-3 subunit epsilon